MRHWVELHARWQKQSCVALLCTSIDGYISVVMDSNGHICLARICGTDAQMHMHTFVNASLHMHTRGHTHTHGIRDAQECQLCPLISHASAHTSAQMTVSYTQVLQRRYLDNVPSIVPLLEREYRHAAARLEATRTELRDLQHDKLKVGAG